MRLFATAALVFLGCAAATDFDHYSSEPLPMPDGGDDDDDNAPRDAGKKDSAQPETDAGPPTFVQSGANHAENTASIAAGIAPSKMGNLLIVAIALEELKASVDNVKDDQGNTYLPATAAVSKDTACDDRNEIWFAKDLTGGVTTVTVNLTTGSEGEIWVIEASGVSTLEDAKAANDGPTSPSVTAPTVTTSAPRSFVVSTACSCDEVTETVGPFTNLAVQQGEGTAWLVTDKPGSYGAVWKTKKPETFNASTAAFKP